MKELEKSRYFDSVLAGTHMLIESMDVRELHSAFKVVSELQQKIVLLLARIAQTESNKLHSPGSSNLGGSLSSRPNTSMPRKDHTTPIISSVNTSRLSLDARKGPPSRESEALAGKKRAYSAGPLANGVGMLWAMNTFLLPSPDTNVAPDTDLSSELTRQGLGLTVSSSTDRRSLVNTAWSPDELMAHICRRYPRVPSLSRVGFTYCYRPSGNQRHLIAIQSKLPYDLYSLLGNEGILFLKPKSILKPQQLRPGGPQETICIDDDDDDAGQPTPISTGRRQQPMVPPMVPPGVSTANHSPGPSVMPPHHQIRGLLGPGSRAPAPLHHLPPPPPPPHHLPAPQPLRPAVSMPPPQMVPGGVRSALPVSAAASAAIPLPTMTSQSVGGRAISLPMPPPTTAQALFGPGGVPKEPAPAVSSISAAVTMSSAPVSRAQMMDVLKLPVEGPPVPPAPAGPEKEAGVPPEKRQAMAANSPAGASHRRLSDHSDSASGAAPPQPPPPPPPPTTAVPPGDLLNQIRACMQPQGEKFRHSLIRGAMELQGAFFSCRSLLRTFVPGAKRQVLADPQAIGSIGHLMRLMAKEELGTVHAEVGAKNARDTGFVKAWPLPSEALTRYNISEAKYAQALLKPALFVQSTVDRDLSTLAAAADWSSRKEKISQLLRKEGADDAAATNSKDDSAANGGVVNGATTS